MEKKDVLIIVDMQNDFVDGCLGSEEARAIIPGIRKLVNQFDGTVIYTKDTHQENYLETQEGSMLPVPHCIKGTKGWEITGGLLDTLHQDNVQIIEKETFGSKDLAMKLYQERGSIKSIKLAGVCTDICVVSNALLLKAFLPDVPITVLSNLTAGTSPAAHQKALDTMRSCQIIIE